MAALPECLAGSLACGGRREEEEEKIFERRHGIRGNLRNARIVCQFAISGRGSDEDKSPHQVGMTEDEAIALLHELELVSLEDLQQMDHYQEMEVQMPPWMEAKLQLIFFAQMNPLSSSLH